MNVHSLSFPEYAKDIKLNFSAVLTEEGAPGLSQQQIDAVVLAVALLGDSQSELGKTINQQAQDALDDKTIRAVHIAVAIMSMNNVYYRSLHLLNHADLSSLPAKLRMTMMSNPGVPKLDFEIYAFAISSINGCGQCLKAHVQSLEKEGLSLEGIQSILRISSVVQAAKQVLALSNN